MVEEERAKPRSTKSAKTKKGKDKKKDKKDKKEKISQDKLKVSIFVSFCHPLFCRAQ